MKKSKNGYNAVIETAENNYYIELENTWSKKYDFTVYAEGDAIWNIGYQFKKLKKSDFTSCVLDFLNAFKIRDFQFMEY